MDFEKFVIERLAHIEQMLLAQKEVMTVKECATYLRVTEDRVRHLISNAELPYYKNGGKTLISRKDVEVWQTRNRIPSRYENLDKATTYIATQRKVR